MEPTPMRVGVHPKLTHNGVFWMAGWWILGHVGHSNRVFLFHHSPLTGHFFELQRKRSFKEPDNVSLENPVMIAL